MRGVLARKEVDKLRNEEMQFLGMSRKAESEAGTTTDTRDPLIAAIEQEKNRKDVQATHFSNYDD